MELKLPVGVSDFKKLIENNYFYVDKSLFIEEIVNSPAEVLLLPRPRSWSASPMVQLTVTAWVGVAIWAAGWASVPALRYFFPPLLLTLLLPARAVEALCESPRRPAWLKATWLPRWPQDTAATRSNSPTQRSQRSHAMPWGSLT